MISNFEKKYISYYVLSLFFLLTSKVSAQNDTILASDLKATVKDSAVCHKNIPYSNQIGYCSFQPKKNRSRFESSSKEEEETQRIKEEKWHNLYDSTIGTKELKNNNTSEFTFPDWPILYIDYKAANKSQLTAGLEICLDCKNNDEDRYFLGLGYGITNSYNGKYYGLPDLHLSYNWELFFLKGGVSNRHAYALAGISAFNLMDLGFGYSQSFNIEKTPYIQGFTFGATIRLAKNSAAYQKMKIM